MIRNRRLHRVKSPGRPRVSNDAASITLKNILTNSGIGESAIEQLVEEAVTFDRFAVMNTSIYAQAVLCLARVKEITPATINQVVLEPYVSQLMTKKDNADHDHFLIYNRYFAELFTYIIYVAQQRTRALERTTYLANVEDNIPPDPDVYP